MAEDEEEKSKTKGGMKKIFHLEKPKREACSVADSRGLKSPRRKKWRYFFFMQLHVRTSLSCCAVPFRCWRSCLNSRISSKPGYRKRNGLAFLCFKMLKTSILFTRGFKQAAANESACNLSFLQVISACAVSHPCSEALVLTTFTTWLKGLKRRTLSMLSASLK